MSRTLLLFLGRITAQELSYHDNTTVVTAGDWMGGGWGTNGGGQGWGGGLTTFRASSHKSTLAALVGGCNLMPALWFVITVMAAL